MNEIETLRVEMTEVYSNAIDLFSKNKNEDAFNEMMRASKMALKLANISLNVNDIREYKNLSDYYSNKAKSFIRNSSNFIEPPTQGFDDFIGLNSIKEYLDSSLIKPWLENRFYDRDKHGILIYGPHGVSKTRFAHALFKELKAKVFYIKPIKHFRVSEFSDIEHGFRELFSTVKKENNVVFFIESPIPFFPALDDEISKDISSFFIRVFSDIMKKARRKKLNVLLVMTTSVPDGLNKKIFKTKLFDDLIRIDLPDEEIRTEICKRYLKNDELIANVVKKTEGCVTSDVSRLAKELINASQSEEILSTFVPEDIKEYYKSVEEFENSIKDIKNIHLIN